MESKKQDGSSDGFQHNEKVNIYADLFVSMASVLQGKIKDNVISILVLPEFIQTIPLCSISITDSIYSLKATS